MPKASLFYFLQEKKKNKKTKHASFCKARPTSFCITRIVFDVLQSTGDCHGGILFSTGISGGLATSSNSGASQRGMLGVTNILDYF